MLTDVPIDSHLVAGSTGPADVVLVDAVSTGDVDAFLELWRRHREAAYDLVRRWSAPGSPPEPAVNRAFSEVMLAIAAGCDVDGPFRLHLYRTLSAETRQVGRAATPLVVRAFEALSPQSRTVLWYTVVEAEPQAAVSLLTGVRTEDLNALLRTAEAELRTRWLTEIVEAPSTPPTCAWAVPRIDLRTHRVLAPASEERYDSHLARCPRCRQVVHDLADVGGLLLRAAHALVAPREPGPREPDLRGPDLRGPDLRADGRSGRRAAGVQTT